MIIVNIEITMEYFSNFSFKDIISILFSSSFIPPNFWLFCLVYWAFVYCVVYLFIDCICLFLQGGFYIDYLLLTRLSFFYFRPAQIFLFSLLRFGFLFCLVYKNLSMICFEFRFTIDIYLSIYIMTYLSYICLLLFGVYSCVFIVIFGLVFL